MTRLLIILRILYPLSLFLIVLASRKRLAVIFESVWKLLRDSSSIYLSVGILLILIGVPIFAPGMFENYALNAWTEFLSIVAGVALIDRLRAHAAEKLRLEREQETEKLRLEREQETESQQQVRLEETRRQYQETLKRQVRSRSLNNAIDAIETIRDEGWLDKHDALLAGANLTKAKLDDADLHEAFLQNTNFEDAKLISVDLKGSVLIDAIFKNAILTKVEFQRASLAGCNFSGAKLENCKFKEENDDENNCIFTDSKALNEISFNRATIVGKTGLIDLRKVKLSGVSFNKARLENVDLTRAELKSCDFTQVKLKNVVFIGAKLQGAYFSQDINYSIIQNISFEDAEMASVNVRKCEFTNVRFNNVDFAYVDCRETRFVGKTDFSGASLHYMKLDDTRFKDVLFDDKSTLFDGTEISKHWANCYLDRLRKTAGVDDVDEDQLKAVNEGEIEDIIKNFKQKILTSMATYSILQFHATFTLPRYEINDNEPDDDDDIDDIQPDLPLSIHDISFEQIKDQKPIEVYVEYSEQTSTLSKTINQETSELSEEYDDEQDEFYPS